MFISYTTTRCKTREENPSIPHEERGICIRGIPREENRRGKRGIDQYKKAHFRG